MLKLIYHTAVFGPIDFEYDLPVVRVGSSEDNDLVLRHPSIEPHHCLLVFRDEKVLWLPPSEAIPSLRDLPGLAGPELGPGDQLSIGDLRFSLAHSSRTVFLPQVHNQDSVDVAFKGDAAATGEAAVQRRYYCARCQAFIQDGEVKRVGLVGHAKRDLCPRCSRPLETEPDRQRPSLHLKKAVNQMV